MRKALRDLFPGDVFYFPGEEDDLWKVLVKYTENRVTVRKGDVIREVCGSLPVVLVKKKEKEEKKEREGKPLAVDEIVHRYNPRINKGMYVEIVFLVSLLLGIIAFAIFVGH